ncbi:outer membrane protein with beta-barrel domain [Flavobacterium endophyticum]|uniref:Outer membrane protein with beta-barrel domain n=1 Tax=Flavobacterium endophyticum TaxID=1540163 RepID=A0A495MIS4_9FLAO|nr:MULTISPECIES: DUF6089 family protein [Flavobacterium]RKS25901.1 outer membrane protein with beta-barrel domain [Flavobacterium endophyticum]WDO13355.1 DUF6089 family protein [Flavobacterium sp. WW92]
MNRIIITFFCILSFAVSNAQIHEIGIFAGGNNYIGDVGPTNYVKPNEFAFGVLYKWNKSPRHSWRVSYTQGKITSDDKDSDMPARKQRGLNFENSVKELSLGLEFNFFDFNLHESGFLLTPYVYSGISYFRYTELYYLNNQYEEDDKKNSFAIPMTVGVKTRIAEKLILGFEVGARYTFTDNLDGSNPKNDSFDTLRFGNLNSKDWYVFSGFTLTYTFGNKPCYCAE